MNLDEIDDIDGLAARVEREQNRRQRQREKEERRQRERERAEQRLQRYFEGQTMADLRVLAEGGEPAIGPPVEVSRREQIERAEAELRERGETVAAPSEWVAGLSADQLEMLSHGHRSVDDARGCCPGEKWAAVVRDAPAVSKGRLADVAQEEIERRRHAEQEVRADGGVRGSQMVAGVDSRTALIALVVGGLVLLGG